MAAINSNYGTNEVLNEMNLTENYSNYTTALTKRTNEMKFLIFLASLFLAVGLSLHLLS